MEALLFNFHIVISLTLIYFYLLKAPLSNEGSFRLNNKLYQNVKSEVIRYLKAFWQL